jgi:alpha-L-rhamnosidase
MNSLNHYSYGSVCEAIYSRIAGLRNAGVGWKKVVIKPHLNYRMKRIDFSYDSISGKYEIYWEFYNKKFYLDVKIPYGCIAEIILPNNEKYIVEYGNHHYECTINRVINLPLSIDTPPFINILF